MTASKTKPSEYEWPENITPERRHDIALIIWTIHDNSPIENSEGRSTSVLMDLLKKEGLDISGHWLSKTLVDLEVNGAFGHFIDRDINGKRTYGISIARDPKKNPFPADPRKKSAPVTAVETVDEPGVVVVTAFEDPAEDEAERAEVAEGDDVIEDLEDLGVLPGVALEALPEPSRADKILYIVSLLNEILTDELAAPQRSFEDQIGERLTAVNAILEENVRLKQENDSLREDKRKLAAALTQANAMMRDRAGHGANGQREPVTA